MAPDQILHVCAKELKYSRAYEAKRRDKKYHWLHPALSNPETPYHVPGKIPDRVCAPNRSDERTDPVTTTAGGRPK
jgi:hypothetical protein